MIGLFHGFPFFSSNGRRPLIAMPHSTAFVVHALGQGGLFVDDGQPAFVHLPFQGGERAQAGRGQDESGQKRERVHDNVFI
ncbi:hypothetical protein [Massilia antarctica]|uniref:hypothetical protein n=1 Tax=Massilia antarctica TaxID=2765360 RepID=UPI0011AF22C1|nr:hypothetical protein [Massilia sp. H27-R4]MCY0915241.1 hypothetical protein [Massilia sp. H27-R4]